MSLNTTAPAGHPHPSAVSGELAISEFKSRRPVGKTGTKPARMSKFVDFGGLD